MFEAAVLFYGDHAPLAERFLEAWGRLAPGVPLRIGLNACGGDTLRRVEDFARRFPACRTFPSAENLGKVRMMRRMLREPPLTTPWTMWFDDDSFPFRADWLSSLEVALAAQPDAALLGIPAIVDVGPEIVRFVERAPWYRGRALGSSPVRPDGARIEFVLGGFWVLRTDWLRRLDWPDDRLIHFDDDYLLGEAVRQGGGTLGRFRSGVRVDTAPRRAPRGMPGTPGLRAEGPALG